MISHVLRTSLELLRSVSRLVSPDNPSYIGSSRRDYGCRTGRLGRTSAGVRPPNRTARTHVGPADIVRYGRLVREKLRLRDALAAAAAPGRADGAACVSSSA